MKTVAEAVAVAVAGAVAGAAAVAEEADAEEIENIEMKKIILDKIQHLVITFQKL